MFCNIPLEGAHAFVAVSDMNFLRSLASAFAQTFLNVYSSEDTVNLLEKQPKTSLIIKANDSRE